MKKTAVGTYGAALRSFHATAGFASPAPGVTATIAWGRGALVERVEMQPDAAYPAQTLDEELFVIVQDGSATIDVDGTPTALGRQQALYLQPGTVRSMKAGGKNEVKPFTSGFQWKVEKNR